MSGTCTMTAGKVWANEEMDDVKLNQAANPIARVDPEAITDRELQLAGLLTKLSGRLIQPNFFLNGNFDLPFWDEGLTSQSAPVSAKTMASRYWFVTPGGAGATYIANTTVPDGRAFFSLKVTGASGVTEVDVGQDIPAWISRGARTWVVISAYVLNNTGSTVTPQILISTADAADDFTTVTLRSTNNTQAVPASASTWQQIYKAVDLSAVTNAANGIQIKLRWPSGSMDTTGKSLQISEAKIEVGVDTDSLPSGYVFEAFDANIQLHSVGGRQGYTATVLTSGSTTWTCGTTKIAQNLSGTLSGATTLNLSRTAAFEGARFKGYLSVVTTPTNTLTFQENGTGSLLVFNTSNTLSGYVEFIYTGSAWILIDKNITLS